MASQQHQEGSNGSVSLYSTCSRLPLIKSPTLRVPPPISLPNNLHPLPPNVQDYMVYPFSLEAFVLDAAAKREREKRAELQRRAPGWTEGGGVLEPTKRGEVGKEQTSMGEEGQVDEIGAMLDQLGRN